MGIFDSYQFAPQAYGGQQGGLLDLIRAFQQVPQKEQQQPANYFQPQPAPAEQAELPSGATPTTGPINILPPQVQQPQLQLEQPGGFRAGIENFIRNAHTGPIGALLGGVGGAMGLGGETRNQTAQALVANGLDPQLASVVVKDPHLLRAVLPQLSGIGGRTDDIKEFEYAQRQGFKGTLQDWMQRKRAGAGEYGMQPIWGVGKDGKPIVLQLGKSGTAIASTLPDGVTIARDPIKIDGPTGTTILDPQTRQPVGFVPKDVAGAAKQKEIGEAQGQAAAKLPATIIDAEQTSKRIDELLSSEGLDSIVGAFDQFRPSWSLDSKGRDALARLEQLQGGAFLQAFNTLKGGGAITEIEGQKAERAIARMQRSQSEGDFRAALMDFRDALSVGIRKLRASAGETGAYPESLTKPQQQSGATPNDDLKKKYGLK